MEKTNKIYGETTYSNHRTLKAIVLALPAEQRKDAYKMRLLTPTYGYMTVAGIGDVKISTPLAKRFADEKAGKVKACDITICDCTQTVDGEEVMTVTAFYQPLIDASGLIELD